MNMHNPPHPGAFIRETYLSPYGLSVRFLATHLEVSPSTINRIINEKSDITPDMAHRLSAVLGRSAESWLMMQAQYDLWIAKQPRLKRIDFSEFDEVA